MASGSPSAENAGADTSATNKDLTGGGSYTGGKSGPSTLEDASASYNPLNIGGNAGLPSSVSSPL